MTNQTKTRRPFSTCSRLALGTLVHKTTKIPMLIKAISMIAATAFKMNRISRSLQGVLLVCSLPQSNRIPSKLQMDCSTAQLPCQLYMFKNNELTQFSPSEPFSSRFSAMFCSDTSSLEFKLLFFSIRQSRQQRHLTSKRSLSCLSLLIQTPFQSTSFQLTKFSFK